MIAASPLNSQAIALEDAETEIRLAVKYAYMHGIRREYLNERVKDIIRKTLRKLRVKNLQSAAIRSLIDFYIRQYREMRKIFNGDSQAFAEALLLIQPSRTERERIAAFDRLQSRGFLTSVNIYGVPNKEFMKKYINEEVRPVFKRLAEQYPKDPGDISGRNSLRNRAEMEVRYQRHLDSIEELRAAGHKLVIASTHADCSERCAPFQGRVYSLDGTSGTTDDGRPYVPLEVATNVPYTTRAGVTYMNGLLGFNCYDDQTEVLTNEGWKHFVELNGYELFYTLNTTTRESEWQAAKAYYKDRHMGEMMHIYSETADLCVTPDHSLLYFTQKNKRLRFKSAREFSTATYMYAGQEWTGISPDTVLLGGKQVQTKLYCRLMAYWLADGSIHDKTSIKIAQTNNQRMFAELSALPFQVWRDNDKIVIRSKQLRDELSVFGKCDKKYIPDTIKSLSREYIREFIDAFIQTDGYMAKPSVINEHARRPHLSLFTVSNRMAADLCELALKGGYRPKMDIIGNKGRQIKFKNGTYTLNHNLCVVHLNYRTTISKATCESVNYDGYVYCVEVPNHTLLVKRNGRIQWCGNCRHFLVPYKSGFSFPEPDEKTERKEYAITKRQRQLERNVREWKVKALINKDVDREEYLTARKMAISANKVYITYSREHGRAYYPDRVKLI